MLIVLLSLICRSIARERILWDLLLTGLGCASLGSIDSIRDQLLSLLSVLFSLGAASGASAGCNRGNHLAMWVVGCLGGWLASNGIRGWCRQVSGMSF